MGMLDVEGSIVFFQDSVDIAEPEPVIIFILVKGNQSLVLVFEFTIKGIGHSD